MIKLLELAIKAALKGGESILEIYNNPNSDFQIERKSDNSPLTLADKASNKEIVNILSKTNIPILSEEIENELYEKRKDWKKLWILDPLDGTKEFIKKNGEFTVNIALVKNGIPIMGVIYVPVKEILYFGDLEQGAYKCSNINVNNFTDLNSLISSSIKIPLENKCDKIRVVASRSHKSIETETFINNIINENKEVEIVSMGSSLKICLVAEGSADVYPRFAPTMEWDTAAGHAIVKATGKEIYLTDEKTPLIYNKEDLENPWFIVK